MFALLPFLNFYANAYKTKNQKEGQNFAVLVNLEIKIVNKFKFASYCLIFS